MLALFSWIFPQPVQAKTKTASLPEAIGIKQEVKELNNEPVINPSPSPSKAEMPRTKSRPNPVAKPVTPATKESYGGRHYSKEEVQALIIKYANQYNINPAVPLCIAKHESGYNQFSKNKSSSASGVFQYLSGTWKATDEGRAGFSVFDADANVRAAIKYMASRKSTQPWVVGNKCPTL